MTSHTYDVIVILTASNCNHPSCIDTIYELTTHYELVYGRGKININTNTNPADHDNKLIEGYLFR